MLENLLNSCQALGTLNAMHTQWGQLSTSIKGEALSELTNIWDNASREGDRLYCSCCAEPWGIRLSQRSPGSFAALINTWLLCLHTQDSGRWADCSVSMNISSFKAIYSGYKCRSSRRGKKPPGLKEKYVSFCLFHLASCMDLGTKPWQRICMFKPMETILTIEI